MVQGVARCPCIAQFMQPCWVTMLRTWHCFDALNVYGHKNTHGIVLMSSVWGHKDAIYTVTAAACTSTTCGSRHYLPIHVLHVGLNLPVIHVFFPNKKFNPSLSTAVIS